jgi:hypothetical protein
MMANSGASSIGTATMAENGEIVLELRAELEDGLGEALFRYAPGTPEHADVLQRLGGLMPGESKPVFP